MVKILRKVGVAGDKAVRNVCAFLLLISFLASLADISLRTIVGASLPWTHAFSKWTFIAATFIYTGVIIREHAHVSVDFIYNRLKGLVKRITLTIHNLAMVTFCTIYCIGGFEAVIYFGRRQTTRVLGVLNCPWWPIMLMSVAIGGAVAVIFAIVTLIEDLKKPPA